MTSLNLTEKEARERSSLLRVAHYDIELDVTGAERFSSRTTITFSASREGSSFIDLNTDEAPSVFLDGSPLSVDNFSAEHGIKLTDLQPGDHTLVVEATIPYSRTGQGLHRAVDPVDGNAYMYTQFETADAKRVFACFDQPDMKATYSVAVTAGEKDLAILNEPVQVEGTTHRCAIDYPLSTYLVALCVGPYHQVTDTWRGKLTHHPETPEGQPTDVNVPLSIYCRASLAQHLDHERLFTETKQGFDFYHRNFGVAYPFSKYDQIFVPEFNMGAMENAGCVTIRDEYVFTSKATHYRYERRADTVLHEMAHMWFGDLVTMKWWGDLWLNESFATWSAAISQAEETAYTTAWVTFAIVEKAWAYQQDQLPSTHPISTDASDIETVEQNFDGITYAKGASVLKQLQAFVGREAFFAGVRLHFARHGWSNATFDDLLASLEETSGRDLGFWADQWLKTTGVNHIAADFDIEDGKYTRFELRQTGDTLRTHRLAVGVYSLVDGTVTRTQRVELDVDGPVTPIPELVGADAGQLVLPNDDDLTYALIDLDPGSLDFVVQHIERINDPMARTLCWSATWEMTRDGALPARRFIDLISRGAHAETELAVLERILNQAATAQRRYADPAWAASSELLCTALLDGARNAHEEAALVFEKTLASIQLNDAAAAYFTELLEDPDADRRWRATTALVARGDFGPELIETQAAKDRSASGRLAALEASAAAPGEENKRRVWEEILSGEKSNLESRHLMAGLKFSDADGALDQFNEDYYLKVVGVWKNFPSEMALQVADGIFPSWNISHAGLDRAQQFLEGEIPNGLRRVIVEGAHRVKQALRNREVDAQA